MYGRVFPAYSVLIFGWRTQMHRIGVIVLLTWWPWQASFSKIGPTEGSPPPPGLSQDRWVPTLSPTPQHALSPPPRDRW